LRRTYISIALLANRFDVLWVMSQVGHADSKMTMDVYDEPEAPSRNKQKGPATRAFRSGETRTRTGDTTIFSRVLYQLSYLAVGA
jgi:hypothetical protein